MLQIDPVRRVPLAAVAASLWLTSPPPPRPPLSPAASEEPEWTEDRASDCSCGSIGSDPSDLSGSLLGSARLGSCLSMTRSTSADSSSSPGAPTPAEAAHRRAERQPSKQRVTSSAVAAAAAAGAANTPPGSRWISCLRPKPMKTQRSAGRQLADSLRDSIMAKIMGSSK